MYMEEGSKMTFDKIVRIFAAAALCLQLAACDDMSMFKGTGYDLNQVAINNLPGITGDGFRTVVMESDSYGRRLFVYVALNRACDETIAESGLAIALMVCQGTEAGHVYFYADLNFIAWKHDGGSIATDSLLVEHVRERVTLDEIAALKDVNDWGRPIDRGRCARARVSRYSLAHEKKLYSPDDELRAIRMVRTTGQLRHWERLIYQTSDAYGRVICFFRLTDPDGRAYISSHFVIFQPDLSIDPDFGVIEVSDPLSCQEEVIAFKEQNGWGTVREWAQLALVAPILQLVGQTCFFRCPTAA